ncbi:MAG: tetratricopeptide repeat protein [Thermodesulfobacteriota bacterium]
MPPKTARAVSLLSILAAVFLAASGCAPRTVPQAPAPPPAQAFESGRQALEQGRFDQAAKDFAAAAADPGRADARYYLGLALEKDAAQKARQAYEEALLADPALEDAMESLGLLLANQGDTAQAKSWLVKAGSKGGISPEALVRLGDIYLTEGNCQEALAVYQKAAGPQVGYAPAARRLEALRGLCGGRAGAGKTGYRWNAGGAGDGTGSPAGGTGAIPAPAAPKPGPKTIDLNDI